VEGDKKYNRQGCNQNTDKDGNNNTWRFSEKVTVCTAFILKYFLVLSKFYEKIVNRISQVSSIVNETQKQWLWKLANCTLKSILLTKTINKILFDSDDYKRLTL